MRAEFLWAIDPDRSNQYYAARAITVRYLGFCDRFVTIDRTLVILNSSFEPFVLSTRLHSRDAFP